MFWSFQTIQLHFCILEEFQNEIAVLNLQRIKEELRLRNMKTESFLLYLSGSNYLL